MRKRAVFQILLLAAVLAVISIAMFYPIAGKVER